mmetsp:Transcript_43717/g.119438  ORF Transcript_43717/g.119438 Transcript_43717/m.119438 type:complete len:918 (-) Transcript_43717:185-2938(-)
MELGTWASFSSPQQQRVQPDAELNGSAGAPNQGDNSDQQSQHRRSLSTSAVATDTFFGGLMTGGGSRGGPDPHELVGKVASAGAEAYTNMLSEVTRNIASTMPNVPMHDKSHAELAALVSKLQGIVDRQAMLKEKNRMEEVRRRQEASFKLKGGEAEQARFAARGPKVDLMLKARAQEIFDQQDEDHSGTLDAAEMQAVMRQLGYGDIERSKILKHLEKYDHDGNGTLDFDEFFGLFLDLRSMAQKASLRRMVSEKAVNGSGAAGAETDAEVSSTMANLRRDCSKAGIIHPTHNSWNGAWDLFVTVMLVLTLTTLPMAMAFEDVYKALFVPNLLTDVIFCTDIVKNFFTGYVDLNDMIVLDPVKIRWQYGKTWFLPDLVSSIPLDVIMMAAGASETSSRASRMARTSKMVKMLRLVRLAKVFRLLRVGKVFQLVRLFKMHMEDKLGFRVSDGTVKLVRLVLFLLVAAHWIACLSYAIVRIADYPAGSWVTEMKLHCGEEPEHFIDEAYNYTSNKWIDDDACEPFCYCEDIDNVGVAGRYFWSLYKALSSMILLENTVTNSVTHYCDQTTGWCVAESWIQLITYYIGAVFYSLLISNISSILLSMNIAGRVYQDKIQQVNEYMRSKHLPPDLRDRVREFYQLQFAEGKLFDEEIILKELTPSIRKDILRYNARELLDVVPLLSQSPKGLTLALAECLLPLVAFEGEVVCHEDTTGTEMYFIYSGIMHVTSKYTNEADAVVVVIGDGCYFGEVSLMLNRKRCASVKAKTVSVLYSVSKASFMSMLDDYRIVEDHMRMVATERLRRLEMLDPTRLSAPGDEDVPDLDTEDSKTGLFEVGSNGEGEEDDAEFFEINDTVDSVDKGNLARMVARAKKQKAMKEDAALSPLGKPTEKRPSRGDAKKRRASISLQLRGRASAGV